MFLIARLYARDMLNEAVKFSPVFITIMTVNNISDWTEMFALCKFCCKMFTANIHVLAQIIKYKETGYLFF